TSSSNLRALRYEAFGARHKQRTRKSSPPCDKVSQRPGTSWACRGGATWEAEVLLQGDLMPKQERAVDVGDNALVLRLNAIITLLVRANDKDIGENMVTLSNAGLGSAEIAKILGRSDS